MCVYPWNRFKRSGGRRGVCLAVAAFFLVSCTSTPVSENPRTLGGAAPLLGLCEDYPEETRSLDQARRDLEHVRTTGGRVLRIAFGWDAMEPVRGAYDWSFWDEFVPLAVEKFGVQLVPYVCYTPEWAARPGRDAWRSPPRDPTEFARFVEALVTRYRPWIRSWELWNEPDNDAYWQGSASDFAALVRAGSKAVRKADPGAKVVLGGIAWNLEFLDAVLATPGVADAIDVVNVHAYFETWHAGSLEELPDYLGRAQAILAEHAPGRRLWLAEAGYSSGNPATQVSAVYRAPFLGEHTAEAQATALLRTYFLALSTPGVDVVAWYRVNDLPPSQEVIGDQNNRHLGVVSTQGERKPAYAALTWVTKTFGERFQVVPPAVLGPAPDATREEVAPVARVFELAGGARVIAAWLPHPGSAAPGENARADERRGRVHVPLPGGTWRVRDGTWAGRGRLERAATGTVWNAEIRGPEVVAVVVERSR